ncbi:hypothetical protein [Brevibacillus nitrificans]
MFFLQIKPNFSPLIKAILFALISSFVAEPIIAWLDLYIPIKWEYIYSFPIQLVIYLLAHALSKHQAFAPLDR